MRILILNYEFPPLGGGAGLATSFLLNELAKDESILVDLVTSSTGKQRTEHFAKNIRIHFLDIKKGTDLHQQKYTEIIRYAWKSFWYSRKLMKQKEYSVCHVHCGVPCGPVALMLGLPYIVTLHGSDVPFHDKRHFLLDCTILWWLQRIVCQRATAVVGVSQYLAHLAVRAKLGSNILVIPNGVNMHQFAPKKNPHKSGKHRIINVGRLVEQKDPLKALFAFLAIHEEFPDLELHFVGDGPLLSTLRETVQQYDVAKRVILHGNVPHDRLPQLLQESDLFLITSHNEGLSLALLEAMACGLPVVCTKGASGLIVNGNGIVVADESVDAVAMAIRSLLLQPELMKEMSTSSRKIAIDYSWEDVANQYSSLYASNTGTVAAEYMLQKGEIGVLSN